MFPNATEICNGIDDNCMGGIDEELLIPYFDWYQDNDGDGYGNTSAYACSQPEGYVALSGDCDDENVSINPGAAEVCNNIDDNCVNGADEESLVPYFTWYQDNDNDGYGTSSTSYTCAQPDGYSATVGDCNDGASSINPSASEVCGNGTDENCNGDFSEGCSSQYVSCGGPGAMQPGRSLSCSPGGVWVHRIRVSSGCNDGEGGTYTFTLTTTARCRYRAVATPSRRSPQGWSTHDHHHEFWRWWRQQHLVHLLWLFRLGCLLPLIGQPTQTHSKVEAIVRWGHAVAVINLRHPVSAVVCTSPKKSKLPCFGSPWIELWRGWKLHPIPAPLINPPLISYSPKSVGALCP